MNYYFDKIVDMQFENAVQRVREGLKKSGFGVLTEIDVQQTLKQKIGVETRRIECWVHVIRILRKSRAVCPLFLI